METAGPVEAALFTVTVIAAEVVKFANVSRATAVNVCDPLVVCVVFHVIK